MLSRPISLLRGTGTRHMASRFRYRLPRVAGGLTVLVIAACGSDSGGPENGTIMADGSAADSGLSSEGGASVSRDGGQGGDARTSDATTADVAVDGYSPRDAAASSGDAAPQNGDAALPSGDAAQPSGDAGSS